MRQAGVFRIALFSGLIEICQPPTLVAMITNIWKFWHEISHNSVYIRVLA